MNRLRYFYALTAIALLIVPIAFTATLTVKQDGSADTASIQDALSIASDGDTIIIDDSGTYTEDVTASPVLASLGIPSAAISSFTLQAGEGQTPVILAANAETSQRMAAVGVEGKDMLGFTIWGCKNVTIRGIEIVNTVNEVNSFNVQSSLVIVDSQDVTIENCTLRGPNARSSGEANCVLVAGVQAQPYLTDNITLRDCLITESHYGAISAVFQKGSGTDPNHVLIENCRFIDGFQAAVDADNAHNMVIRNCYIENYQRGIHIAGSSSLVEDCTIVNCKNYGIDCDVDTNWTDKITGATFRRCAVISNGMEEEAAGIRCADGPLLFENCIIAGNSGPGIHVTTGSDQDVDVTFDHCDIYENFGLSEVYIEGGGSHLAELTVKNSNIVSTGSGFENELEEVFVTAHHNNVFVQGDAYLFVNPTDSISTDPLYVSPTIDAAVFSFDGFKLQDNSPVLAAGEDGSAIGAHGNTDTAVYHWNLF